MTYENPSTVDILLPIKKDSRFLEEAVNSLIKQTYTNWVLVAIIDFDDLLSEKFLLKTIQKEQLIIVKEHRFVNLSRTLNVGLQHCKNNLTARMDADDICHPNRLKKQVDLFSHVDNKTLVLCGSQANIIDQNNNPVGSIKVPTSHKRIVRRLLLRNSFVHPSVMFRTEVVRELQYDENVLMAQDYELWLRCAMKNKVINLDEKLISYRLHGDNQSLERLPFSDFSRIWVSRKNLALKYNFPLLLSLIFHLIFILRYYLFPPLVRKKTFITKNIK